MGREPPQWGPEGWSPGHCAVLERTLGRDDGLRRFWYWSSECYLDLARLLFGVVTHQSSALEIAIKWMSRDHPAFGDPVSKLYLGSSRLFLDVAPPCH